MAREFHDIDLSSHSFTFIPRHKRREMQVCCCYDLGLDCDFTIISQNEDETSSKMLEHAISAHNLRDTRELREKITRVMKEE